MKSTYRGYDYLRPSVTRWTLKWIETPGLKDDYELIPESLKGEFGGRVHRVAAGTALGPTEGFMMDLNTQNTAISANGKRISQRDTTAFLCKIHGDRLRCTGSVTEYIAGPPYNDGRFRQAFRYSWLSEFTRESHLK